MKTNERTAVTIISRWTDNLTYQVDVKTDRTPNMLSEAYHVTNRDDRPLGNKVCSTSIGDLMLVNGEYWLVDRVGFKKLTQEQAVAWQQIPERDAHDGWDWCVKQGVINSHGFQLLAPA